MIFEEPVYGPSTITSPVLLDIMNSKAMQRLHGVLQHGVSALVGVTRETSRFEHSVGVMLLVRRLGATLEEQIAALLHDVSHTAFSHVIDYVFDEHVTQGYHEEHKLEYVAGTMGAWPQLSRIRLPCSDRISRINSAASSCRRADEGIVML